MNRFPARTETTKTLIPMRMSKELLSQNQSLHLPQPRILDKVHLFQNLHDEMNWVIQSRLNIMRWEMLILKLLNWH